MSKPDRAAPVPQLLIVYSRYPESGQSKTRLIPLLGPEGAADIQRRMTARIVSAARRVADGGAIHLELHTAGDTAPRQFHAWLGADLACRPQCAGELGQRMAGSFREAFVRGYRAAVIVGSDIPALDETIIARAFETLRERDLVLGPATDGGYYLIGLHHAQPGLFEAITWGSSEVLRQTVQRAEALGLSIGLLGTLDDIDRPEDLPLFERLLGPLAGAASGEDSSSA